MPNFSVPNNINPGDSLDANKAMANWNQVVTDLNANKIDATNTAASFAKDVVEPAFSTYKTVLLPWSFRTISSGPSTLGIGNAQYLDPADLAAGSRTLKYRLTAFVVTNQIAPAVNFTFAMNLELAAFGTSGNPNTYDSFGGATTGSSVAVNVPASSTRTSPVTIEFTAPAAQFYGLTVTTSGGPAANSRTDCWARLDARQI